MYPEGCSWGRETVEMVGRKRRLQTRPTVPPHCQNSQNDQNAPEQWLAGYEKRANLSRAIHLIKQKNNPAKDSMPGEQCLKNIGIEKGITVIPAAFLNPSEVKNVLVVKLDHLGDMVLARPAITRIRERLREATIWVLCGSWSADLVRTFDFVDYVITFDLFAAMSGDSVTVKSESEKLQLQRKLSSLNLDIAIDLRRHSDTRWILGLSSAPLTIGYESHEYNPTISLPVDSTIADIPRRPCGKINITDQLLRLVDAIPILPAGSKARLPAYRDVLSVGIHPGSGQKAKLWPLEHFSELAGLLLAAGFKVILFGGPQEYQMNRRIVQDHLYNGIIVDMSGAVPTARYAETVANECSIYVGNDTGPTHMVAAAGVPVIAIYSGVVDPMEWFPPGHIVEILTKAMPCMPCWNSYGKCPYNLECITSVEPDHVLARILKLAREVFGHEVTG